MVIHDNIENIGNWLFKRRGQFPFFILPLLFIAMIHSEYIERHYGDTAQTVWEVFCIITSFLGLGVRAITIGWIAEGTSGRNTQAQHAESLNVGGIYSTMRHPLYLGNFLIVLGFVLFVQVWWFVIIYVMAFFLFYGPVIFAEEVYLARKFGEAHEKWAMKTPLLLPDFRKWSGVHKNFSWKMVLKREYSTFFGIIAGFVLIKIAAELIAEQSFELRPVWGVFLGVGFFVYILLRTIRKKTTWLNTPSNS